MTNPIRQNPVIGPGRQLLLPRTKDPHIFYAFAQDKIPIAKRMTRSLTSRFDYNKDAFLQGNYERYRLWKLVGKLQTAIDKLKKALNKNDTPTARSQLASYRAQLKRLLPLYAHLPQVDFNKQTVRVNGRDIKVTSKVGKVSQETLFAIGEALMSMPVSLRNALLIPQNGLPGLTFLVADLTSIDKKLVSAAAVYMEKKRVIGISAQYLRKRRYRNVLGTIKHELGHAIDHLLGVRKLEKKCNLSVKFVVKGKKLRVKLTRRGPLKCSRKFFMRHITKSRSQWNDFDTDWKSRLWQSGFNTPTRIAQFYGTLRRVKTPLYTYVRLKRRHRSRRFKRVLTPAGKRMKGIRRFFISLYGATKPYESFAEMWRAYWTLPSPWARYAGNRKTVAARSDFHYEFFEKLWNDPDGSK